MPLGPGCYAGLSGLHENLGPPANSKMAPKKKGKEKKEKQDPMALIKEELAALKSTMMSKQLEIVCQAEKNSELQERSMYLCTTVETMSYEAQTEISGLQEAIFHVTAERDVREAKLIALEQAFANLKLEKETEVSSLVQQLEKMKDGYEFRVADLQLQLDDAHVELRDMHDFSMKRAAIEAEIAGLHEQLEKEHKQHQEVLGDAERAAVQEKDRMKTEMARKIQETIEEMERLTDQRLHEKTKKAMAENEHMTMELAYQTRQTELLLHKNEALAQENVNFHRTCLLNREIQDDLTRRVHMYQKTMRLLVFKLRALQHSEEQLRHLIYESEMENERHIHDQEALHHLVDPHGHPVRRDSKLKDIIEENSKRAGHVGEEAVKFLYACVEDMELERLTETDGRPEKGAQLPKSLKTLEDLDTRQRRALITALIRSAISLRAVTDSTVIHRPDSDALQGGEKHIKAGMDQILALDVDALGLDNSKVLGTANKNPVSVGVQVDSKELQPKHVRIVKHHHKSDHPVSPGLPSPEPKGAPVVGTNHSDGSRRPDLRLPIVAGHHLSSPAPQ